MRFLVRRIIRLIESACKQECTLFLFKEASATVLETIFLCSVETLPKDISQ